MLWTKCLGGKPEAALYDVGGTREQVLQQTKALYLRSSVHKQIEAAGDREAFLGHSAKQINHLFSYAV